MAKVLISGYYGFHNIGDEAVLYSIVKRLHHLDQKLELVVLSNDPEFTAKSYGVRAINRWSVATVMDELKDAELLISGGGSLLQDVTGPKSLIYYLGVVQMALWSKVPVMFYAQGIGPINSGWGRFITGKVANKVKVVTVRDDKSLEDLQSMGVTRPLLRVTADPVLGVDPTQVALDRGQEILRRHGVVVGDAKRPVLLVSLREWAKNPDYKEALVPGLNQMATQGWQVVFLPMHYPEDMSAGAYIAERLDSPSTCLQDSYTVEETLALIGNADLVLGMRLHALIMAAVMQIPMGGLVYDPKVARFLELVKQPSCGHVDQLTAAEVSSALEMLVEKKGELQQLVAQQMQTLGPKANQSAELVLELLRQ